MIKKVMNLMRNEEGANAAEYALILAVIGLAMAVAAGDLGTAIVGALDSATAQMPAAAP